MTIVVDASVAIKWVIEEESSNAARALVVQDALTAPDFLAIECANVLWALARAGKLSRDLARGALDAVLATPIRLRPTVDYASAAHAIAFDLDQTAYDSVYLAVAIAERARLVTADRTFAAAASRHAVYGSSVRLLGG